MNVVFIRSGQKNSFAAAGTKLNQTQAIRIR